MHKTKLNNLAAQDWMTFCLLEQLNIGLPLKKNILAGKIFDRRKTLNQKIIKYRNFLL